MKRLVVPALFAASLLPVCAQEKTAPRVETKAPGLRDTQAAAKSDAPGTPAIPTTPREAVDALTPADLKDFLNVLREHYIGGGKLTEAEVSRATVQGLLERIAPGASLLPPAAQDTEEQSPFRTETLDNKFGYLRLGALTVEHLGELDTALQAMSLHSIGAAILDMRATPPGSDFELAAKVCERFCVKGRILFTVKRPNVGQEMILTSKEDPRFKGVLVVLVDSDTSGASEVVAAVLRTQAKALVIGQNTKGEAVEFAEVPLPSGRRLRVAVAEVALPENVSVFPGGVKPDVPVDVPQSTTAAVLKAELDGGVAPLVIETERVRLNEAALVAGTNPELDAAQAAARAKGEKPKAAPRDGVLQRAIDAITTIALFESTGKKAGTDTAHSRANGSGVKPVPTETERRRALRGLRIYFAHRRWPRVMMSSVVALSGTAGFFASFEMLRAGVHAMWLRYPLAVLAAWAAFLLLMRLWAEIERHCFLPDTQLEELLHLPDPGEKDEAHRARYQGDGWSWGDLVEPVLDSEGGCIPLLAVGLLIVLLGSAFAGILEIVWLAPALIAEVFLDSVLVAALYRRMKKIDQRWWIGGAVNQTWKPVVLAAIGLMTLGFLLQRFAPGANSIGGVWWHYHPQPLERG